jgi:hypothetical protein
MSTVTTAIRNISRRKTKQRTDNNEVGNFDFEEMEK